MSFPSHENFDERVKGPSRRNNDPYDSLVGPNNAFVHHKGLGTIEDRQSTRYLSPYMMPLNTKKSLRQKIEDKKRIMIINAQKMSL